MLKPFAGKSDYGNMGRRVVEGQRLMQAASDIFLGWMRVTGIDGEERDYYIRQLWDWKGSADPEQILPLQLRHLREAVRTSARTCPRALRRPYRDRLLPRRRRRLRPRDRGLICQIRYADQNEHDYEAFVTAVRSGRLTAMRDL